MYHYNDGELKFSSQAFRCPSREPSHDRAIINNFVAEVSRIDESDGIVELTAEQIRDISGIVTNEPQTIHNVDIVFDPLPDNSAHSKVTPHPNYIGTGSQQKKTFEKIRYALARIAGDNGWRVEPTPLISDTEQ